MRGKDGNRIYERPIDGFQRLGNNIISINARNGDIIRELGSIKVRGRTNNRIGHIITDLLERKSKFRYCDGNYDRAETNQYRNHSAPIDIKFTGGTVRHAVEACLKSDMAYLIQKNDGRLTIRQYGRTYGGNNNSGVVNIPAWAVTQKPTKDYEYAQKMWFSSCLIQCNYNYLEDRHERNYLGNSDEDFALTRYARNPHRRVFETNLFLQTFDTYHARRLATLLNARFATLRETLRLGVGVDTSAMNILDTVIFDKGININDRQFSAHKEWIIREINPAQDKLVLEELALVLWLYENNVFRVAWSRDAEQSLDRAFDWIRRYAKDNATYRIVINQNISAVRTRVLNPASVNNRTGVTIRVEGRNTAWRIWLGLEKLQHFAVLDTRQPGSLTLVLGNNIILEGGGIKVTGNASLIMEEGAKITGSTNSAVILEGNSSFEMHGGIISGNIGELTGGVLVAVTSSFVKTGGIIADNTALTDQGHSVLIRSDAHQDAPIRYLSETVPANRRIDSRLGEKWTWEE